MSLEFEIEAEAVPASHLVRVRCAGCAAPGAALAAPGRERAARCAGCLGSSQSVPAGTMPYTVPTGYPVTFGRGSVPLSGREPYPAPVVLSSDPVSGVAFPGPVLVLEREAAGHGWGVKTAHARGCMPHATTGRPGAVRDSFSVRFLGRGTWQGYAIYAASAWQSIMVTGASLPPFGKMGRTELGLWLADPDRPAAWYDEIRARRAAQALAAKERAKTAPRKGSGEAL